MEGTKNPLKNNSNHKPPSKTSKFPNYTTGIYQSNAPLITYLHPYLHTSKKFKNNKK